MAKEKEIKLPSKTEMNLYVNENENSKQLPYFLVGLAVVGVLVFLFAQFLVINRLNKLNALQGEVNDLMYEHNQQLEYLRDYDEVKEKYRRYTTEYLTADNEKIVDREDIINLINRAVEEYGKTYSFSISDNAVTISVITDNQDELASIRNVLEKSKYVESVEVSSTSNAGEGVKSTLFMKVGYGEDE